MLTFNGMISQMWHGVCVRVCVCACVRVCGVGGLRDMPGCGWRCVGVEVLCVFA